MQAALFQWINPKARVMTVGVTTYTPQQGFLANFWVAALNGLAPRAAPLQRGVCLHVHGFAAGFSLYPIALELLHH